METKLPPPHQRRPHSSAQIVENVISPNLALQSIQKPNTRTHNTSVKSATSHSLDQPMLPDTLMQFTTTWPRCTHASGVEKSLGISFKC